MKRATVPTVANPANSIPDVLGLRHTDGTPITLTDCLSWADRLGQQSSELRQSRETLLGGFDGNPIDRELIRGMTLELVTLRAAIRAWQSLANVFEAVKREQQ